MKKHNLLKFLTFFIAVACLPGCGKSISDAQKFIANRAPEVSAFTASYIGTDSSFTSDRLYSGMPFLITVMAEDPEKQQLSYSLTSSQGTFASQVATDTGITCNFYVGSIGGGDFVQVTLTITDPKNAVFTQTLDIGSGKTGPGISLSAPEVKAISPSGETTLTFSCDSVGSYRVYCDNSITSADSAKIGTSVTLYNAENTDVIVHLIGSSSASPSDNAVVLTTGAANRIWVVFQDSLQQTAAAGCTVVVEGNNPYVVSASPEDNDTNISCSPTVSFLFSKALEESTVSVSTVYMKDSSGSFVTGTVAYDGSSYTVTFMPGSSLSHGSTYP
ncbi:MAG: Ig-like domain-containing protein, partial [Spirochaetota bacterium]